MKILIEVEYKDHKNIELTNEQGETFTSNNEELQDFFTGLEPFKCDFTHSSHSFKATFKKGEKVNYKKYKNATVIEDNGYNFVKIKTDLGLPILASKELLSLATESL